MQPSMTYIIIFVGMSLCYIYIVMSEFFAHKKCNFFHETSAATLIGVVIGVFVVIFTDLMSQDQYGSTVNNLIMLVLLPPILFEDGYNIRKRKFFQNIMYVNLYGLLGTAAGVFVMFWVIYAFNQYNLLTSLNGSTLVLKTWQILAMVSSLISIDPLVAQKIFNPERYPKLFSIIFGESIFKDTIAVTMFDSLVNVNRKLINANVQFQFSQFGLFLGKFVQVIVISILIGVLGALITTFIFKKFRFLITDRGVAQVGLILITGYGGYILSEWADCSGVISMLFCGITLSHFNVYNLTEQGKSATKITVSTLAVISQGMLFFLLGAFIFNIQFSQDSQDFGAYTFSWSLTLVCILGMVLGRFVNIFVMSAIGYLIVGKKKWRINFYEYQVLMVSGLVRGAVPFALILSIPIYQNTTKVTVFQIQSIQNTVITIVFLTTIFCNSLMPKFLRSRMQKMQQMMLLDIDHPSLRDSLIVAAKRLQLQHEAAQKSQKSQASKTNPRLLAVSQVMKSKLIQLQQVALSTKIKSTTQKYWRRCEEGCLKPLFIYDYYNRKQQIKMEKMRKRKEEVEQYWRRFKGENYLDTENQEFNKFIDVRLVENQFEQHEKKQSEDGQVVVYVRKPTQKVELLQKKKRYTQLENIPRKDSQDPILMPKTKSDMKQVQKQLKSQAKSGQI